MSAGNGPRTEGDTPTTQFSPKELNAEYQRHVRKIKDYTPSLTYVAECIKEIAEARRENRPIGPQYLSYLFTSMDAETQRYMSGVFGEQPTPLQEAVFDDLLQELLRVFEVTPAEYEEALNQRPSTKKRAQRR